MSRRHKEETELIDSVPESSDGCSEQNENITNNKQLFYDSLLEKLYSKRNIFSTDINPSLLLCFSKVLSHCIEETLVSFCFASPAGGRIKFAEFQKARNLKDLFDELRQKDKAICDEMSFQEQVKEVLSTKNFFKRKIEKEAQRGRPRIERLCPHFEDEEIVPLLKKTFKRYYKYAIERAKHLTQYLTCFVCAFFDLIQTETVDGRVAHFWRIVKNKIKKGIPSVRTLQDKVRWLLNWDRIFSKNKNPDKEEAKHNAWMELQKRILDILLELNPQFAF